MGTYKELAQFVYDITGQEPTLTDMPKEAVKTFAKILQYERTPMITPDLVDLWSEDYLPQMTAEEYKAQKGNDKILTMADCGIEATPIEKIAFRYLHRFRQGGHFAIEEGYH